MSHARLAVRLGGLFVVAVLVAAGLSGCGGSGSSSLLPGTVAQQAALTTAVHVASAGLGANAVHAGVYDGDAIRAFIAPIRFLDDKSGYFYVYDYTNNVCLAHAINTTWVGQDKTNYQDSRGVFVIQELSKIAKGASGSGFLVYHWNNPATGKEVIPGTTLYLGSGIYVAG
jgi:signal transduction histidine kinase